MLYTYIPLQFANSLGRGYDFCFAVLYRFLTKYFAAYQDKKE